MSVGFLLRSAWCAASAPDGNDIVKRWKSLMNHVCNTHDDCYHDPLNSLEERRKLWFVPGTGGGDILIWYKMVLRFHVP